MHGLTGGSWKRHTDRTRATEMKDTRGNLAVTSGSETYRRCALPRQLSTLLPRRNRHNDQSSLQPHQVNNLTMPCKRLGVAPETAAYSMGRLWGQPFSDERDYRAGPDANAQRRGQISRALQNELRERMALDGNS